MKKINSLLRGLTYLLCCLSITTFAQTYNGPGGGTAIDQTNVPYEFDLVVSGVTADYALTEVAVDISHTWSADLDISLIAPDGTEIFLSRDNGGSDNDAYTGTSFRDDAAVSITTAPTPFTGAFIPEEPLSTVYGQADGTWTLRVIDDAGGDTGTFNSWSLTFAFVPPPPPPPPPLPQDAYTSTVLDGAIPDNSCPTTTDFPLEVSGVSNGYALAEVVMDIDHTWTGDLEISLIAPDGSTTVLLSSDNGGSGNNYEDTSFRDDADTSITAGSAPFNDTYRPEEPLSNFVGQTDGTWYLKICDDAGGDLGTLNYWSLIFEPAPVRIDIPQECVTAYIGYCPELSVEILDGTGPFTYFWSDGSTEDTLTACPTENTVYTVTVRDYYGRTATDSASVIFSPEDVSCQNGKVMICHVKPNGDRSTLCIATEAVEAHLAHGDTVGNCDVTYYTCDSAPSCPTITAPSFDAQDLSLPVTLEWSAAVGLVDGYHVSVGTSPGGTDVVDNADVGLNLEYTLSDIDFGTTFYATVTAYNANGDSENCNMTMFSTQRDPCSLASTLTCASSTTGTTVGASLYPALGSCDFVSLNTSPGNWYTFVGNGDIVTVDTEGSTLDTKLGVFSGTCGDLTCIDGDNNGGTGTASTVTFASLAGTTYYFYVTGNSTDVGSYQINVSCVTPLPNDSCDGALAVRVNDYGSECAIVFPANHTNATDSGTAFSCDSSDNIDSWYTFIGPANGVVELSTVNISQSGTPGWAIYDECSGAQLFCANNTSTTQVVDVTPGVSYVLAVWYDTFSTPHGEFNICINEGPPRPDNNSCSGAIALTVNAVGSECAVQYSADHTNATDSGANFECDGFDDIDTWYTFVAPASGAIEMSATEFSQTGTPGWVIYDVCDGGEIFCVNNTADAQTVQGLTPGVTYVLAVWYDGGSTEGTFDICVNEYIPPGPTELVCGTIISETYCYGNNESPNAFSYASSDGGPLTVTFISGATESCCDDFIAYDGSGAEIGTAAGSLAGLSFTSTDGILTFGVDSDSSVSCGGTFSSYYWSFEVYCGFPPEPEATEVTCGTTISENYCYGNGESPDAFWYESSDGGPLTVTFISGATESCCDDFIAYDGSGAQIGTAAGSLAGLSFTSTDGTLVFGVDSDSSISCGGTFSSYYWSFEVYCGFPPEPEVTEVICGTPYNEVYCYDSLDNSTFRYSSSNGSGLTLDWNSGSIESSTYDHIYIYDGTDSSGVLLYTNGGGTTNLAGLSLFAASGNIFIQVDSDGSFDCNDGLIAGPWDFDVSCNLPRLNNVVNDWSMAPNPTKGNVTLDLTNYLQSNVNIEVVDFTGKVISTANVKEVQSARYTLELRNSLPAGMYFVRVAANGQVSTKKLMIMR